MAADDEGAAKQLLKAKASKYDFVKVRVWIGEHYHVLSRFLLSRMLSATRVSEQVCAASLRSPAPRRTAEPCLRLRMRSESRCS
jgi:hypothetical protein